jgi:hypothetical protein
MPEYALLSCKEISTDGVQGHKQSQIDDLLPWNFVS